MATGTGRWQLGQEAGWVGAVWTGGSHCGQVAFGTGGSQEGRWQLGQEAVGVGMLQSRQVGGNLGQKAGGKWDRRYEHRW